MTTILPYYVLDATIFLREKASEKAREDGLELPSFDFPTIAAATDNFSDANKLGAGGFGPVYKVKFSFISLSLSLSHFSYRINPLFALEANNH